MMYLSSNDKSFMLHIQDQYLDCSCESPADEIVKLQKLQ